MGEKSEIILALGENYTDSSLLFQAMAFKDPSKRQELQYKFTFNVCALTNFKTINV